ncbi:ParB/RepB/Spo0J family partition protein [Candidatus Dojkabacteria bacterium]|jgi:ParB/RepB/Spo0J family partition protein|nr:ParB/RepB/Spo0J family partition protein [Candidatus Dojkabacteria bacterium]
MTEITINDTKRKDILLVDPKILKIEEGFNTRVDYGDIDELMNSIIENGVQIPLKGYKEGDLFVIVNGHRRFKAIQKAIELGFEIARIPFISEKKKSIEERIFDIIITNDGKQLTSLELGETYKKLMNYNFTIPEIAKKIGKTYKHVADCISVAECSKDIKTMIQDGDVSATLVAEVTSKVKDADKVTEIIRTASDQNKITGKKKVTKRDIELNFNIEKTTEKTTEKTYTLSEVKKLLIDQITACANRVEDEDVKYIVSTTKLVLNTKVEVCDVN